MMKNNLAHEKVQYLRIILYVQVDLFIVLMKKESQVF